MQHLFSVHLGLLGHEPESLADISTAKHFLIVGTMTDLHQNRFCLLFYSLPSYLTDVTSLRLVGAEGARNYARNFSQWTLSMTSAWTPHLSILSKAFYPLTSFTIPNNSVTGFTNQSIYVYLHTINAAFCLRYEKMSMPVIVWSKEWSKLSAVSESCSRELYQQKCNLPTQNKWAEKRKLANCQLNKFTRFIQGWSVDYVCFHTILDQNIHIVWNFLDLISLKLHSMSCCWLRHHPIDILTQMADLRGFLEYLTCDLYKHNFSQQINWSINPQV